MKLESDIKDMYDFIGYFNDGVFMNRDYRAGILDALSFVLYDKQSLEIIRNKLGSYKQRFIICGACWLKGKIQVNCPECHGKGVVDANLIPKPGVNEVCPSCDGNGQITAMGLTVKCSDCHGKGIISADPKSISKVRSIAGDEWLAKFKEAITFDDVVTLNKMINAIQEEIKNR